jgi:hypothetical protein
MNAYLPDYIQLSILGSRTVRIAATASAVDGAVLTLWVECAHRIWNPESRTLDPERAAFALTADQARELIEQMQRVLGAGGRDGGRLNPRRTERTNPRPPAWRSAGETRQTPTVVQPCCTTCD